MGYSFNNVCSNILPSGTYKVQIEDIKFRTSSTGAESFDLQVHYRVVEGPQARKTLVDTIYEKAASFRLLPFLKACDIDTNKEFGSIKELYNFGIKEAKGKQLLLEVGIKLYNGNKYNEVKSFTKIPGSTTSVEDVLKEFDVNTDEKPEVVTEELTGIPENAAPVTEPKIDFDLDSDEDISL